MNTASERKLSASTETRHALLEQRLTSMDLKLADLIKKIDDKYVQQTELALLRLDMSELRAKGVSQDQFYPVKVIVFGAVGLILASAMGAILTLVIRGQS